MVQPDDDADPLSLIQGLYRQLNSTGQPHLRDALLAGPVVNRSDFSPQWLSHHALNFKAKHAPP